MATRPVSWHYVGEFPEYIISVLISENGDKVVVIGVDGDSNFHIWSSTTDVLDISTYSQLVSGPHDIQTGVFASSKDLNKIFFNAAIDNKIQVLTNCTTFSTVDVPVDLFVAGNISCSSTGYHVISPLNSDSGTFGGGLYYSDDSGSSWTYLETYDPDTGIGYFPNNSCVSDNAQKVYAPGAIGEGVPREGYSETGINDLQIFDPEYLRSIPLISSDGNNLFVGIYNGYTQENFGLFLDPMYSPTLILEDHTGFRINSTGDIIVASSGTTIETALVQHSTDTGATWVDGPKGFIADMNAVATSFGGSRLGAIDYSTNTLWLTGLSTDQTGGLILAGNTPFVDISSLLHLIGYVPTITVEAFDPTGILHLIGYVPTITVEAFDPTGILHLIGYAPIIPIQTLTPMTGTLNLTGYLPIVIRDAAYHFVRTIFFSPTHGTPDPITVTVNYDDGTLLPIYSDSGLTQPIDNPFALNLTTLLIDFYVSDLENYYNVVLTGGNLVGTVTIDENGG